MSGDRRTVRRSKVGRALNVLGVYALLALLCVAVGLAFPFVVGTWLQPAADALGQGVNVALNFIGF